MAHPVLICDVFVDQSLVMINFGCDGRRPLNPFQRSQFSGPVGPTMAGFFYGYSRNRYGSEEHSTAVVAWYHSRDAPGSSLFPRRHIILHSTHHTRQKSTHLLLFLSSKFRETTMLRKLKRSPEKETPRRTHRKRDPGSGAGGGKANKATEASPAAQSDESRYCIFSPRIDAVIYRISEISFYIEYLMKFINLL